MRLRIIQPQCLGFDVQVLLGIVDVEFFEVGIGIEKLLMIRDAVILDPIVGAYEAIGKPPYMSLPIADEKIKIVRSIARGSG